MDSSILISSPIVSVAWLQKNLKANNLVVLDGTINKVFDASTQQIPNARLFDIKKKFSDVSNAFPSAFPSKELFQESARELGINNDSAIVVYDDKGIYSCARVWWMFLAMGFEQVAVLNGGMPAWQKTQYPCNSSQSAVVPRAGDFVAHAQVGYFCDVEAVFSGLSNQQMNVLDARSPGRFSGVEADPREGMRSGHMPGAVNMHYALLFEEDGLLKSRETDSSGLLGLSVTTANITARPISPAKIRPRRMLGLDLSLLVVFIAVRFSSHNFEISSRANLLMCLGKPFDFV